MVKNRLKQVKAKNARKSYYKSISYESPLECYPDNVECYPDVVECYPDGTGMLSRCLKPAIHRPQKERLPPLKVECYPDVWPVRW